MPETRDEVTTWVAGEVAHWKQLAKNADAVIGQVRALHDLPENALCVECYVPKPCPTLTILDTLHGSKEQSDA
jgi:hypothetical protein